MIKLRLWHFGPDFTTCSGPPPGSRRGVKDLFRPFHFLLRCTVAFTPVRAHSENKRVVRPPPGRPARAVFLTPLQPWKRSLFMNLTISGHHLEVTPALRGYVTSKLDRITRHFDQVVDVKVLLTVDNMK